MKNNMNLVEKLEEQAQWHDKLMLHYANKKDGKQKSEYHAVAAMSYLRAAQMARVENGKA